MSRRSERTWLVPALALVLALGVASLARAEDPPAEEPTAEEPAATEQATETEEATDDAEATDVGLSAMKVGKDEETGRVRPATPAESRELAREMAKAVRKHTQGKPPEVQYHRDGTMTAVVAPHHLVSATATVGEDGKVHWDCAEVSADETDKTDETAPGATVSQTDRPEEE